MSAYPEASPGRSRSWVITRFMHQTLTVDGWSMRVELFLGRQFAGQAI
jgi:hypothetical protein